MSQRLDDDQLEALFLTGWLKTRSLRAALRLVRDAVVHGEAKALARAAADERHEARPAVVTNIFARSVAVVRAMELLGRFAEARAIKLGDLIGRDKGHWINRHRQDAMWMLKHAAELSYPEIGLVFDGRDHTVAMNGVRRAEARIAATPAVGAELRAIVHGQRRRAA